MNHKKYIADKLLLWECTENPLAKLTELQVKSVDDVSANLHERPLPLELPIDDEVSVHPSTASLDTDSTLNILIEDVVIENTQQFLAWYSGVEENIVKENDIFYQTYVDELVFHQNHFGKLLDDVTSALDLLASLQNKYTFVSNKTNALHEACEHLLAEQAKLVNSAESISQKLCYFNELETLSQKLASPTLSVLNESFVPLLSHLDECISYLIANEHYRESSVYLAKFQHLQATALGMIRNYVVSTLQQATQQVLPKRGNLASTENVFTLYYGKFRSHAPRIRALMKQIEERVDKNKEYQPLLLDCHQCYFNQREILLGPSVSAAISDLAVKHVKDHCTLVRSGCAFLLHVCGDEYQLFKQFFFQHAKLLEDFLESLCIRLYDVLRPIIIHINHLETLAELCGILKIEMLEEHVQYGANELEAFETVVRQMLEDVQERLVYRTHVYMKTDILSYNPCSGDLAYPEKLEMMESIAQSLAVGTLSRSSSQLSIASTSSAGSVSINSSVADGKISASSNIGADNDSESIESSASTKKDAQSRNLSYSPADLNGLWYATVRRTIVCLSKLYRCLDRTIFQGLSQEVLTACIQSLIFASDAISKRKTPLDGQLFQLKHLLILREQIAPFQIDFAIKETTLDFSNVKVAAYSLLQKRYQILSLNSNNSLLEFLLQGAPHVTEHLIDSKKAIDKQLKVVCEEFISHTTTSLVGPLQEFLEKAKVIAQMRSEGKAKDVFLKTQPFATAEKVSQLVTDLVRNIKGKLPSLHRSLSLYLSNPDTEYILFRPVKMKVQQCFDQLLQIVRINYSEEEQIIIACPSTEQISVLLSAGVLK